jgi:hypothetical protein
MKNFIEYLNDLLEIGPKFDFTSLSHDTVISYFKYLFNELTI